MPDIVTIERKFDRAPNIVAVVNLDDFYAERGDRKKERIPIRGYIFDIHIQDIYGGVMQAAQHFIMRTFNPKVRRDELFTIGFIKGKIYHDKKMKDYRSDRDIVYCPFVASDGRLKTQPKLIKNAGVKLRSELGKGELRSFPPNINQDMLTICAAEAKTWEEAHKKTEKNYSEFIRYLLEFGTPPSEIKDIIEAQRQKEMNPLEYFCSNLPEMEGIEYTNIHTINI